MVLGRYLIVEYLDPSRYIPRLPNVPVLSVLWYLLDGIWGLLKDTWAVLVTTSVILRSGRGI